ncbi:MAG: PH domain-containing protein [Hydrogenophaga sp.]|uniref:PH domain-containing protein n=1 Tax=Hydrogenophaga sp. TaxID=1904254 RepID=UPI0027234144|nr:PH domain-containing protein [Hydrogenophaga sp.]MDO9029911.1 PH domain-containing protein [Hydrogenophaga sp.]
MQVPESIRDELSPGEQVVWSGQPRQGVVVRGSDALAIPFSLLWAGFAVFWLVSAAQSGAPLPFVLFGVPFVLVGLYIVVGRFFVEAKQREKTFYALTPHRVIIASGLFSRKVRSMQLKTLSEISLSERSDGTGTISFGAQHPMASMFGGMSSWPGAEQYLGPRFDLVPQARSVYEAVRKTQAGTA